MNKNLHYDRKVLVIIAAIVLLAPLSTVTTQGQEDWLPVPREESYIVPGAGFQRYDAFNHLTVPPMSVFAGHQYYVLDWEWYPDYGTGGKIFWRVSGWDYEDDYTTFVLHVREGVKWNDGEPFTSADYVFTYNMFNNYTGFPAASLVRQWIQSVEAPDDYTVIFHLKSRNEFFHSYFTGPGFPRFLVVAEHIWKDQDPRTFKNFPPVETGPYKLYELYPEANMAIWEKVEDYWAEDVLGITFEPKYLVVVDAGPIDVHVADFVSGNIDVGATLFWNDELVKTADRLTNMEYQYFGSQCTTGIKAINTDKYPMNIREVRWAICYCTNWEKIASVYPTMESWNTEYPWIIGAYYNTDKYHDLADRALQRVKDDYGFNYYEYNLTKAGELLDSVDIIDRDGDGIRETANGTKMEWDIISYPKTKSYAYYISEELQSELKKVGISCNIDDAWTNFVTRGGVGDFHLATGTCCPAANIDVPILAMLDMYHSRYYAPIPQSTGSGPMPRYNNPEFTAIIDELWTLSFEDPRAQELYEEALYIFFRDAFAIGVVEQVYVQTWSTEYWTGHKISFAGYKDSLIGLEPNSSPYPVQASTSDATATSIELNWEASTFAYFASYEIFQSTTQNQLGTSIAQISDSTTTSQTITDLEPHTTYYFTVRVSTSYGKYADSQQTSSITELSPTPFFQEPLFLAGVTIVIVCIATVLMIRKR